MRKPSPFLLLALALALTAAAAEPPAHAAAGAGKDVDIKAADGTHLKGTFFAADKPGPGVILLHMCNSERKAWANLAPMLTAKGIHVLTLDYRGYGESGGPRYTKWTDAERRQIVEEKWPGDLDKAFAFLVAQQGVDKTRIGAGGGSCGVNNAIQLARRHPEVKTLALLAGGTNPSGQEFLAATPWMPLFFAGAHDDGEIIPVMRWTMGFSSNPQNTLKEYADGGHGTHIFPVHKDLEPSIAAWFEKQLITQPVAATRGPAQPGPSAALAAKLREPGAGTRLLADLRAARTSGGKVDLPPEGVINALGYEQLQAGRVEAAIELFVLNVEAHPDSANTYDSLSEAYVAAKDGKKAAETARKTLDALARDKGLDEAAKKALRETAEKRVRGDAT